MKTILLLIGLFFLPVSAQQTINKPVLCDKAEALQAQFEKFGERIVWTSPSPVEKSNYIFYGNRDTGTWSLLQVIDGIACLVAFGETAKVRGEL
jgi:hypothetical protein